MYANNPAELSTPSSEDLFLQTDLGRLYQAIPFEKLAAMLPKTKGELSGKGCKPWLSKGGGIGLVVLKHYLCLSDAMLIERLNTDWALQRFCGLKLKAGEKIKDEDLPRRWRAFIGDYLDIDQWQLHLASEWKPDIRHPHLGCSDATCYESYITYPTDSKLIWKCCREAFALLGILRKQAKLRRSRAKQDKYKAAYLTFSRLKKKSRRKNKKLCRHLLKYLDRLLTQIAAVKEKHPSVKLKNKQQNRLEIIEKIKKQSRLRRELHYFGGQSHVPDRIVSLHKPYIRPIVRGKETKPVEPAYRQAGLGLRSTNSGWMASLSLNTSASVPLMKAYGSRAPLSYRGDTLVSPQARQMGADAIYATNENRRYCNQKGIATCFVPKGKQGREAEQKAQMRTVLGRVRGTRLEGSFGTEKQHYLLDKIKARTEVTEIAWIFFGIFTSNAVISPQARPSEDVTARLVRRLPDARRKSSIEQQSAGWRIADRIPVTPTSKTCFLLPSQQQEPTTKMKKGYPAIDLRPFLEAFSGKP